MRPVGAAVSSRPDTLDAIRDVAETLLLKARAPRIFPTPVDAVIAAAAVEEIVCTEEARARFVAGSTDTWYLHFDSAWKKLRGSADVRDSRIFVMPDVDTVDRKMVRLHELGHVALPWHRVRQRHEDDAMSLSPACQAIFDREADAFAAEIVFQASHFEALAGSMRPGFDAVFRLARLYGASPADTARYLACDWREPLALLTYTVAPNFHDNESSPISRLRADAAVSSSFLVNHGEL